MRVTILVVAVVLPTCSSVCNINMPVWNCLAQRRSGGVNALYHKRSSAPPAAAPPRTPLAMPDAVIAEYDLSQPINWLPDTAAAAGQFRPIGEASESSAAAAAHLAQSKRTMKLPCWLLPELCHSQRAEAEFGQQQQSHRRLQKIDAFPAAATRRG